ncbi:MAG: methyltransferase domain-containing protein [Nitrococcus sp.]|nr:methyltransferase domain-containing protein [Nitrococcus sp.]
MAINEDKLNELLGRALVDFGATWQAPLIVMGERLGLYRAIAEDGPLTSTELAERTGTRERYVREWLRSQAAGGYASYDTETDRYSLTPEQVAVLVDEDSPTFLIGAFQGAVAAFQAAPRIEQAFRGGGGLGWHEHDAGLFHATERLFRPNYANNLVESWLPALNGITGKLTEGARVADIGCGHGASTVLMAQAYAQSIFVGYDYHEPSIGIARKRAEAAGVADRASFQVASAKDYDGSYDLVAAFDCLHDMGDPVGVAEHVLDTLEPDGAWMLVEPFANDRVEQNLNPLGRAFYSISTLVCTPCSLSQEVGYGLGAQAGEARIREVVTKGGFGRFRRAAETPFNLIYEARP